jgi:hypothetical protein
MHAWGDEPPTAGGLSLSRLPNRSPLLRLLSNTAACSSGADPAHASPSSAAEDEAAEFDQPDDELLQSMLGQPRPKSWSGDLRAEVLAEVELSPGGLQLALANGGSSGNGSSGSEPGSSGRVAVGEPVRWLPPLAVTVTLPASYPSSRPPVVKVHAAWLTAQQRRQLERGLDTCWEEQGPGLPVLFAYLEWLKEATLEHLGICSSLQLFGSSSSKADACGSDSSKAAGDEAEGGQDVCMSSCGGVVLPTAEQMAMQLLRYHGSKEQVGQIESLCGDSTCLHCFYTPHTHLPPHTHRTRAPTNATTRPSLRPRSTAAPSALRSSPAPPACACPPAATHSAAAACSSSAPPTWRRARSRRCAAPTRAAACRCRRSCCSWS